MTVLTGAGISVASGLRPYRGPGGLWSEIDVQDVVTAAAYFSIPAAMLAFLRRRPDLDNPRKIVPASLPELRARLEHNKRALEPEFARLSADLSAVLGGGDIAAVGTVDDRDDPPPVVDQAGGLKLSGRFGDPLPTHPHQVGDHLLSDLQPIARYQVETEEQPAAQLLIHRVVPVAENILGNLGEQGLGIAQGQPMQAHALVELPAQHFGPQAIGLPRTLHHHLVIGCLSPQNQGDANHAVLAGHRHLGGRAVFGGGDQGEDTGGGKVRKRKGVTRLIQHAACRQRDEFQVVRQPGQLIGGQ